MKNNSIPLTSHELNQLFSPIRIRHQAQRLFQFTQENQTHFKYHPEKLAGTVEFVLKVIREQYPDLNIPFHSRWGHFRAGGVNRHQALLQKISSLEKLEQARIQLDLVITSVLLDAGAGAAWKFHEAETAVVLGRSEGLGIASFHLFMSGALSSDKKSLRADIAGLESLTAKDIEKFFQVSDSNPLVGVGGRVKLLNNLAQAVKNKTYFPLGRPGSLIDYLMKAHGSHITAEQILKAVIEGLGSIWPRRLQAGSINLGDVWYHSRLGAEKNFESLVPFHKLSQWMTYSLIEPMLAGGLHITGVENLTGLAEYRNGGLILDSGLVQLKDQSLAEKTWTPDSELIIEWRALTIALLDIIGEQVQKALGRTPQDFPLAKVLEGGTWWAGRRLAKEKRANSEPPLKIQSDGTVF